MQSISHLCNYEVCPLNFLEPQILWLKINSTNNPCVIAQILECIEKLAKPSGSVAGPGRVRGGSGSGPWRVRGESGAGPGRVRCGSGSGPGRVRVGSGAGPGRVRCGPDPDPPRTRQGPATNPLGFANFSIHSKIWAITLPYIIIESIDSMV